MSAERQILTLNVGSSSLKFSVWGCGGDAPHYRMGGKVDRIGTESGELVWREGEDSAALQRELKVDTAAEAVPVLYRMMADKGGRTAVVAHRVVHGGPSFTQHQRMSAELLDELRRLVPLAPNHLPGEIEVIEAARRQDPEAAQVACFDTAFYAEMPRVARLLPLPRRYEKLGVRRYGFHGLSYAYLIGALPDLAGAEVAGGRVILAHLGNGASMTAVRQGNVIDTTMGMTPLGGLVMATRSGDLDPGIAPFLARTERMTPDGFERVVAAESGMKGLSESSGDVRDLLAREREDVRAAEALEVFCYQARKWAGALAAALGGLDLIVFAGGIGENSPEIRRRICEGLAYLDLHLDKRRNGENERVISDPASRVLALVLPTDEETAMARIAWDFR